MNNEIFKWELIGMIFIILVGSLFHFVFELSGNFPPVGAIAAVNESVWEHLKLGYWPLVFFSIIEYKFLKDKAKNIGLAKLLAAITIILTIIIIFYSYTAILGEDILIIDILSFVIAIIVGQIVSYKVLSSSQFSNWINLISWTLFIILGVLFVVFTYFPPELFLFEDPLTGLYGIID
jgi:hypothetical protein